MTINSEKNSAEQSEAAVAVGPPPSLFALAWQNLIESKDEFRLWRQSIPLQLRKPIGVSSRTLSSLRWIEVIGQFIVIIVVGLIMDFPVALQESLALIAILALLNIYFSISTFRLGRLSEGRALPMLAVDIIQVAALTGFNGGITNPFLLMILVPLVVSATILSKFGTCLLSLLAIVMISLISIYYYPFPWHPFLSETAAMAVPLSLPPLYLFGIWIALVTALTFLVSFVWMTSDDSRRLSSALAEATGALAHERELSALGALAAAAAHELGSPLATIAVVTRELKDQDIKDPRNWELIKEDHVLLFEQAQRCREILVALAQKPRKHGGDPYELPSITGMLEEIAKKHLPDTIQFQIEIESATRGMEPKIPRRPELLNGIGNLLSNAGQFANKLVLIKLFWDWNDVRIIIHDDGPGFPSHILLAAGEPYKSTRSGENGHMGLGLFIAITLLESIHANLRFRNHNGAEITIKWNRDLVEENET